MGQAMNKDRAARCYNLFRRKLEEDLYCAVPEDRPVPSFLTDVTWNYAYTLREGVASPPGFDQAAAELGVRLIGFHLFLVLGGMPSTRSSAPPPSFAWTLSIDSLPLEPGQAPTLPSRRLMAEMP